MVRVLGFFIQFRFDPVEVHSGCPQLHGVFPKAVITFAPMKSGPSPFLGRGVNHRLVKFAMSSRWVGLDFGRWELTERNHGVREPDLGIEDCSALSVVISKEALGWVLGLAGEIEQT